MRTPEEIVELVLHALATRHRRQVAEECTGIVFRRHYRRSDEWVVCEVYYGVDSKYETLPLTFTGAEVAQFRPTEWIACVQATEWLECGRATE